MEYEDTNYDQGPQESLELNETAITNFNEARKWARFLAILGFIAIGFMVIIAFFIGSFMSSFAGQMGDMYDEDMMSIYRGATGTMMTIFYLILAGVYFFPILFLYQFSVHAQRALRDFDNLALSLAFGKLKAHYQFLGILAIILLVFYAIMFFAMMVFGAFAAF